VTVRAKAPGNHTMLGSPHGRDHRGRSIWSMRKILMLGVMAALVALAVRKVRSI